VRWRFDRRLDLTPIEKILRLLVRVVFLLDIVFVGALFGLVAYGLTHLEVFSDRGNTWFHLIQVVGVLGAAGIIFAVINAGLAWISKRRSIWGKLQATLMLLACLGVLWFSLAGNLLHFSSTY